VHLSAIRPHELGEKLPANALDLLFRTVVHGSLAFDCFGLQSRPLKRSSAPAHRAPKLSYNPNRRWKYASRRPRFSHTGSRAIG
jgi:hypothetical protein